MTYKIQKYNPKTDKFENYGGGYSEEDMKVITKGYQFNRQFYERKNSKNLYIVETEII